MKTVQETPSIESPVRATTVFDNNFVSLILRHAELNPHRVALVVPRTWNTKGVRDEEILTYGNLAQRMAELSLGFRRQGFQIGDRVVVLFPLCTDFYAVVLALLASGMTAVLIDSGMGSRRIGQALKTARAQGIVSVHALLKYRFVLPLLRAIPKKFSRDTRGIFMRPFQTLEGDKDPAFRYVPRNPDDEALITFTSGSTGQPKGVDRTHGLLTAQHLALRQHFPDDPEQVDMPCFPVVALHNLCCGITTVMPPVDLRAPSLVDPSAVLSQVTKWKVSSLSGAPAYIKRIADHLLCTGRRIPTVRRMAVGGAPASVSLCRKILQAFPGIEASVVYGSTEAEPISSVSMESVIQSEGDGFLVGKPARMADVALVNLPGPPPLLDRRDLEPYGVVPGEVGELVVQGPHVSRRYIQDPKANRACKLQSIGGGVWHRTGDLARFDANRDLWLVGRLADVVRHSGRTLYPLVVEAAIDSLPGIKTSALVMHAARPNGELAVETENEANRKTLPAVLNWLKEHDLASLPVRVVQKIPVDGRHNCKVDRPTLRKNLELMHRVMTP